MEISKLKTLIVPDLKDVLPIVDIDGGVSRKPILRKTTLQSIISLAGSNTFDPTSINAAISSLTTTNNELQSTVASKITTPTATKASVSNSEYLVGIDENGVPYEVTKANLLAGVVTSAFDATSINNSITALQASLATANTTIAKLIDANHVGFKSGRYYPAYNYPASSASGTTAITVNNISYYPFKIERNITIDRLSISVPNLVSGSSCRLGIYDNLDGLPHNLLLDAGIFTTTTTGVKEATVNCILTSGWYWLGGIGIGNAPNLAMGVAANPELIKMVGNTTPVFSGGFSGCRATNTGGALPLVAVTTALSTIAAGGAPPLFCYRVF